MPDVTQILSQLEAGDHSATEALLPLVYTELRRLAATHLAREKPGQTLQATALVHEAYLRLVDADRVQRWDSRGHFFAAAAEAMRRILIERARSKNTQKRGGGRVRLDLDSIHIMVDGPPESILQLDHALEKLTTEDDIAAQLVKLRLFAGLRIDEAAKALEISSTTAYRHWNYARAWLHAELVEGS